MEQFVSEVQGANYEFKLSQLVTRETSASYSAPKKQDSLEENKEQQGR